MAEVIKMPHLSDTMTEGVIVAWHKNVGDKVKTGDLLAEIETDKAVMEFESYQEGTLLYIGAQKGQTVPVDSVIAVLGKEGEDYKAALEGAGGALPASVPDKKAGEQPAENAEKKEEAPVKEATPKPAKEQLKPEPVAAKVPEVKPASVPATSSNSNGRIKASPLAKKMASDSGVNIQQVKGTGDEGRITKRDIQAFISSGGTKAVPFVSGQESYEDVPLSQMRKTIARRLSESMFTSPHFYLNMEVSMDKLMDLRKQINEVTREKISFNDLVIKASALALRKNPKVNASWLGDKIRYNHHIHIGMAVAVEEGLLVPVIKFADQKSLSQISTEAKLLGNKAKERKLQPSDWEGNTFSISNLGMMDIDEFTAIINPPDSCILAVGKIKQLPVVDNGQIRIGNTMKLTLSCDHRSVDGATGALFLQTLKSYLENPVVLLLN